MARGINLEIVDSENSSFCNKNYINSLKQLRFHSLLPVPIHGVTVDNTDFLSSLGRLLLLRVTHVGGREKEDTCERRYSCSFFFI